MSLLDDSAADVPVRDVSAAPPDSSVNHSVRARQDISRVSREELEDRFLRLHDETLLLKQHIHKQDDKIKKLGTKLMRLVKDRGRMEQLASGRAHPVSRGRDVEMEEMMEELQEKVRGLQTDNEGLKQRLLLAKQQLMISQSRRPSAYNHVQSRVNSGLKKMRNDTPSPQRRPKSMRSLEGGGRPPTGQLPRYGHSLLEEARAEIRNLEDVIEAQQTQMEEMEAASELLREELMKKEAEYEEKLRQVRQEQTSKLRSHVNSNVTMVKLQKQLAERSNAVTELEGRFLQLQENQRSLKVSHDAAMQNVAELLAQLKDERMKSLDLEKQLQRSDTSKMKMEKLQEQINELEKERDLLKEKNEKLVNSAYDVSQQQKWQIQEQQLKLQITQLETALKADLVDKNEILDRIKAERDTNETLTEENKKLQVQFLEQRQQMEELRHRLKFFSGENEYDQAELAEALLEVKARKSHRSGDLGFLNELDDDTEPSIRELQAAHTETIQELEKTRNILSMERKISKDYKAELETVLKKMDSDKVRYEQQLEEQARLLARRAAKVQTLEAQLRDVAYGTRTCVLEPDEAEDESDDSVHLEPGENLLELHVVGASLPLPALKTLGDCDPSTFLTYTFYLFELHSTPEVKGREPKYDFTSKYVVRTDERFLDYLHRDSLTVELNQALGLGWRTLAAGHIRLQPLLEREGKVHGSVPLIGVSEELPSFGSVDYWLRLRLPMSETIRLYEEKVKAVGHVGSALSQGVQLQTHGSRWNELLVTVRRCRELRSRSSLQPSPYVVYKLFDFPDCFTPTVEDCCEPHFKDTRSYSVLMDADLDRYLRSQVVRFYVFDYKEQQPELYLGKARAPLLSLAQGRGVGGELELTDSSGLSAGHLEVTLKWKLPYIRPEQQGDEDPHQPAPLSSQALLPKVRRETPRKDGPAAKKQVKFVDPSAADHQVVSSAPQSPELEEEDDEEESHVSEGQLVPASSQSYSDDSGSSEETVEDVEDPAAREDQSESTHSDSDDCIVQGEASGRKPSDQVRVEVVSLSLRPESRVAQDGSVVRLFVEYSLLDLPTEETPLSLPKPPQGRSINFNYSKVIPVDPENNGARRRLLRGVLQGRNPPMERIRFTVVSEPPEEEEHERECEDVGVAFIRILEILEKQQDLSETGLTVVDVEDGSQVVGTLTVTVEGLEALQAIMEEQDQLNPRPRQHLTPSAQT